MLTELEKVINARRRIYLLRHGDVSYFDSDGNPHHPGEVPLNQQGREQAIAAGRVLGEAPVDLVITSGLPRTLQTAELVTGQNDASHRLEHIDALREIMPGDDFKKTGEGSDLAFANSMRKSLRRDTKFLGGETFGSLEDRVIPAFEGLTRRDDWRELLVVAHGGTNRMILSRTLGGGLDTFGRLEQDAGCINIIDLDPDGTCLLRLVNYTPGSPVKSGLRLSTMEHIYFTSLLPKRSGSPPSEDS